MNKRFETPDQAEAAFYAAFETLDASLMAEVWERAADCLCLHPGGDLLQGVERILGSWQAIFTDTRRPAILYRVIDRKQAGDLAVHLVEERIGPRSQGVPGHRILASNLYRRTDAGWRLCAHHASLPLATGAPGAGGSQQRLH